MKCVYRVHTWDFRSKFIEIIQDDCNQSAVCMCMSWDYSADILRRVLELRCCCCHHFQWASLYRTKMAIDAFIRHKYRSSSVVLAICICPQWNLSFPCTCIHRNRRAFYRRFQSKTYFTKINSDFNYGISFHFGWIVYVCSVNMCTLYIIAGCLCLCVYMCALAHSPPL